MHKIREKVKHIIEKNKDNMADFVIEMYELYPDEVEKMIDELYNGCHIHDEQLYEQGLEYIKNVKGEYIDTWSVEDIKKVASNHIELDKQEFTVYDLALWANVKKGDYGNIETEATKIIKMAIQDLKDKDFPYFEPSERAYRWLKANRSKAKEE